MTGVQPIIRFLPSTSPAKGEIEASDGEIRSVSPGTVLIAEYTAGRGHRVRVTSQEPVTVLPIHLPG